MSTEKQFITALGPNDPDDGDEGRQMRGLAISALTKIEKNRLGYKVPSQSGKGDYVVALGDSPFCTCPDFESRQTKCKHVYAVEHRRAGDGRRRLHNGHRVRPGDGVQ